MTSALKSRLLKILAQKKLDSESGFTLVELIVVVVIIGILSAIAIPSFQNASDKAKQKEATSIIASLVKAGQAYYTENSTYPQRLDQHGEYITITGCTTTGANCKTRAPQDYTTNRGRAYNSPSGNYRIEIAPSGYRTYYYARPTGNYANTGYGSSGCFNANTGATKVVDSYGTYKGSRRVLRANC